MLLYFTISTPYIAYCLISCTKCDMIRGFYSQCQGNIALQYLVVDSSCMQPDQLLLLRPVRQSGSFRLRAPAAVLGHLGAISLKLPNFLTTSQDVTNGADQAKCLWISNIGGENMLVSLIDAHSKVRLIVVLLNVRLFYGAC